MHIFIIKRTKKISEDKKILEKKLKVKFKLEGRKVSVEGDEVNEYLASSVLEAIEIGFDTETALLLTETDFVLEKIEIKNLTKRRNLQEVRARIIGSQGRTKELVEELTDCYISLHNNEVGVIGQSDRIKYCLQAIERLIHGSKQSSVYAYLEKQRKVVHPSDLGLKIEE